jgi:hypothetical protein
MIGRPDGGAYLAQGRAAQHPAPETPNTVASQQPGGVTYFGVAEAAASGQGQGSGAEVRSTGSSPTLEPHPVAGRPLGTVQGPTPHFASPSAPTSFASLLKPAGRPPSGRPSDEQLTHMDTIAQAITGASWDQASGFSAGTDTTGLAHQATEAHQVGQAHQYAQPGAHASYGGATFLQGPPSFSSGGITVFGGRPYTPGTPHSGQMGAVTYLGGVRPVSSKGGVTVFNMDIGSAYWQDQTQGVVLPGFGDGADMSNVGKVVTGGGVNGLGDGTMVANKDGLWQKVTLEDGTQGLQAIGDHGDGPSFKSFGVQPGNAPALPQGMSQLLDPTTGDAMGVGFHLPQPGGHNVPEGMAQLYSTPTAPHPGNQVVGTYVDYSSGSAVTRAVSGDEVSKLEPGTTLQGTNGVTYRVVTEDGKPALQPIGGSVESEILGVGFHAPTPGSGAPPEGLAQLMEKTELAGPKPSPKPPVQPVTPPAEPHDAPLDPLATRSRPTAQPANAGPGQQQGSGQSAEKPVGWEVTQQDWSVVTIGHTPTDPGGHAAPQGMAALTDSQGNTLIVGHTPTEPGSHAGPQGLAGLYEIPSGVHHLGADETAGIVISPTPDAGKAVTGKDLSKLGDGTLVQGMDGSLFMKVTQNGQAVLQAVAGPAADPSIRDPQATGVGFHAPTPGSGAPPEGLAQLTSRDGSILGVGFHTPSLGTGGIPEDMDQLYVRRETRAQAQPRGGPPTPPQPPAEPQEPLDPLATRSRPVTPAPVAGGQQPNGPQNKPASTGDPSPVDDNPWEVITIGFSRPQPGSGARPQDMAGLTDAAGNTITIGHRLTDPSGPHTPEDMAQLYEPPAAHHIAANTPVGVVISGPPTSMGQPVNGKGLKDLADGSVVQGFDGSVFVKTTQNGQPILQAIGGPAADPSNNDWTPVGIGFHKPAPGTHARPEDMPQLFMPEDSSGPGSGGGAKGAGKAPVKQAHLAPPGKGDATDPGGLGENDLGPLSTREKPGTGDPNAKQGELDVMVSGEGSDWNDPKKHPAGPPSDDDEVANRERTARTSTVFQAKARARNLETQRQAELPHRYDNGRQWVQEPDGRWHPEGWIKANDGNWHSPDSVNADTGQLLPTRIDPATGQPWVVDSNGKPIHPVGWTQYADGTWHAPPGGVLPSQILASRNQETEGSTLAERIEKMDDPYGLAKSGYELLNAFSGNTLSKVDKQQNLGTADGLVESLGHGLWGAGSVASMGLSESLKDAEEKRLKNQLANPNSNETVLDSMAEGIGNWAKGILPSAEEIETALDPNASEEDRLRAAFTLVAKVANLAAAGKGMFEEGPPLARGRSMELPEALRGPAT